MAGEGIAALPDLPAPMVKRPGSAADPLWYQDAIIYELQKTHQEASLRSTSALSARSPVNAFGEEPRKDSLRNIPWTAPESHRKARGAPGRRRLQLGRPPPPVPFQQRREPRRASRLGDIERGEPVSGHDVRIGALRQQQAHQLLAGDRIV